MPQSDRTSSAASSGSREEVATPAATVAAVRDGADGLEVLLLRRNPTGSFADAWVFPGGRVEDADLQAAAAFAERAGGAPERSLIAPGAGNEGADTEVAAACYAAVRETEEEAGLRLDPTGLRVLSWWMPPPEAPRRFATWFFVAAAPGGDVVVDQTEVHDHVWVAPLEAIARRDRGEITLLPPTWMTLWWLAQRSDVASVLADAAASPPERFVTHMFTDHDEVLTSVWAGDEAYEHGDLHRAGPRRRLLLDPAGWRFEGGET